MTDPARALSALTLDRLHSQPVRLADLWADGPVVFVFLRHYG